MNRLVHLSTLGFVVGVVGVNGFRMGQAACEMGCQESHAWYENEPGLVDDQCGFYDGGEQAFDGRVAGDIGTLTPPPNGETVHLQLCPLASCSINCPSAAFVLFQAAQGTSAQACDGMPEGPVPKSTCENP